MLIEEPISEDGAFTKMLCLFEKSIEVYPTSGETLYLGMNEKTITFEGRVKRTFVTEWEV